MMQQSLTFFRRPWFEQIGWALLHSLWMIALIALAYLLVVSMLRNHSASSRYLAGCFALVTMLFAPLVLFVAMTSIAKESTAQFDSRNATVENSPVAAGADFARTAEAVIPLPTNEFSPDSNVFATDTMPLPEPPAELAEPGWAWERMVSVLPWLTVGWGVGVVVLSVRTVWGWVVVRRLRTQGLAPLPAHVAQLARDMTRRFGAGLAVQFFQSALVEVPSLVGYFKPMVLFPAAALTGLTSEQLELILAHELAHVRRHDYFVNVMQTFVESLLFYHPAAWWVSQQVRAERENCCDDWVVAVYGKKEDYARALWTLEKQRSGKLQPALAATGGRLLPRIRRLLSADHRQQRTPWLAGIASIGVVVSMLTLGHSFAQIDSQNSNDQPTAEILQLIALAGNDQPEDPKSIQALQELRELGLAEHVVPMLQEHANNRELLDSQRAAIRVLQRSRYVEGLDALGHCLSVNRWSHYGQETEKDHWQLKRELIAAIYTLAQRASPVDDSSSNETIQAAIPPTLRTLSICKPVDARRIALPAEDPRNHVQLRLHIDKKEWLLGEPVLLHYEAKNLGEGPVIVSFGGDSRTSPARALRFKVLAINEAGDLVDDSYPSRMCMGGRGGGAELNYGESCWAYVPLWRSCAILRPGTYKVRVYHDLGWDGDDYFSKTLAAHPPLKPHIAPVLETTLTFREPTTAEARDVVARMFEMPKHPDHTMGERATPFGDPAAMTQLVYLPLLLDFVEQGKQECLTAIGAMPYPEATAALVDLTNHKDSKVRELAMVELLRRLPHAPPRWDRRRWLTERSWQETFREPVLALGWQHLERQQRESQLQGADLLAACGNAEDMPRYLEIFNQALEHYRNDPVEQDRYPRPAQACNSLLRAGDHLLDRGATPPTTANRPAEGLLMLKAIAHDEDFRPDRWQEAVETLLQHPISFVRASTLEMLPLAEAHRFEDLLIQRLLDKNMPVQAAACQVVEKLELSAAAEPLLEVLRTAPDKWLIGHAYRAATKCGVTLDRLTEICIQRLDEPDEQPPSPIGRKHTLFGFLLNVLDREVGGWGTSQVDWSVTKKLQPRWQKLLDSNRAHLAAGGRLTIGKPPVTHELFPRGFHLTLDDSSEWPDWSEIEEASTTRPIDHSTDRQVQPTEPRDFFPRDPYSELGIVHNAGPGWHFLRVAGHRRASKDLGISQEQQEAIKSLFDAYLAKDRELEARLREEHGQLPRKLWEAGRQEQWLSAHELARALLDASQIRRVEQMMILRVGFHAFLREDVQQALQLSKEQLSKIKAGIGGHYQRRGRESLRRLGREISQILTPQQRAIFYELRGFALPEPLESFGIDDSGVENNPSKLERINQPDEKGFSQLHRAVVARGIGRLQELLDQGADVNVRQSTFQGTPLQYAASAGRLDATRLLLQHNATVDTVDSRGRTPLIWAASHGHTEVVKALLDANADIHKATESHWTPLHYAADQGHLETARLLIDRGANLAAKNSLGKTPVDLNPKIAPADLAVLSSQVSALPAQPARPAVRTLEAPKVIAGEEHVRLLRVIPIPKATAGGVQAATAHQGAIYLAGKRWNQEENKERLWLWRIDPSGEKVWEKDLAIQRTSEEMVIVGLLPGARKLSQGPPVAGVRVIYRQGLDNRMTFLQADGETTLEKDLGRLENPQGVVEDREGNLLLFGSSMRVLGKTPHGWVAKVTRLGALLWKHTFRPGESLGNLPEEGHTDSLNVPKGHFPSVLLRDSTLMEDESIVLVGQTGVYTKFGVGKSKLWLLRVGSSGERLAEAFIEEAYVEGATRGLTAISGKDVLVRYMQHAADPQGTAKGALAPGFMPRLARFGANLQLLSDESLSKSMFPETVTLNGSKPSIFPMSSGRELQIRGADDQGVEVWNVRVAASAGLIRPLATVDRGDNILAVSNYRSYAANSGEQVLLVFLKPPTPAAAR